MSTSRANPSVLAAEVSESLQTWTVSEASQNRLRTEYVDFLATHGAAAVDRDLGRAHITGSAVVLNPDLTRVLLCLHKKAGMWLQLGGHIEPDDDLVSTTAHREAKEEGGLRHLRLLQPSPVDLDRHALGSGFAPCDTHWDIGYVFIGDGEPTLNDESDALRWWPTDALPRNVPPRLHQRVARALAAARTLERG